MRSPFRCILVLLLGLVASCDAASPTEPGPTTPSVVFLVQPTTLDRGLIQVSSESRQISVSGVVSGPGSRGLTLDFDRSGTRIDLHIRPDPSSELGIGPGKFQYAVAVGPLDSASYSLTLRTTEFGVTSTRFEGQVFVR